MTIGTSLFLIAVGAILRYAVEDRVKAVDIPAVGLILMVVGVFGLILGLYLTFVRGHPDPTMEDGTVGRRQRWTRYQAARSSLRQRSASWRFSISSRTPKASRTLSACPGKA